MGKPYPDSLQRAIALSRPTTNSSISGQHPGVHIYLATQKDSRGPSLTVECTEPRSKGSGAAGKTLNTAEKDAAQLSEWASTRKSSEQDQKPREQCSAWPKQLRERPRIGAIANPHWDENPRHLEPTDVRFLGQSRTYEHALSINPGNNPSQ
ncbi:hypothetical protein VP1G_04366 [Cytospora mali]|uniref:Uncharacterized protein n=1 Tax=Cytospora mali TaxID=578113 RepID=A0A194UZL7_CYTMA|nr:hypothetical protein VP1G_04366 [Valsa mali var. pyri (nom. inval.)]